MKKQILIIGMAFLLLVVGLSGCNEQVNKGELPVINFFTATPRNITLGNTTVLNWSVTGATRIVNPGIPGLTEDVALTGSYTVFPTRPITTFHLVAVNSNGSTSADVTVYVEGPTISIVQVDNYILIQSVTNGSIPWSNVTERIIDKFANFQSFATVVENDVDNDTYISAGDTLTVTGTGTLSVNGPYAMLVYYKDSDFIFESTEYIPTPEVVSTNDIINSPDRYINQTVKINGTVDDYSSNLPYSIMGPSSLIAINSNNVDQPTPVVNGTTYRFTGIVRYGKSLGNGMTWSSDTLYLEVTKIETT
jgi:hypothetical protein